MTEARLRFALVSGKCLKKNRAKLLTDVVRSMVTLNVDFVLDQRSSGDIEGQDCKLRLQGRSGILWEINGSGGVTP